MIQSVLLQVVPPSTSCFPVLLMGDLKNSLSVAGGQLVKYLRPEAAAALYQVSLMVKWICTKIFLLFRDALNVMIINSGVTSLGMRQKRQLPPHFTYLPREGWSRVIKRHLVFV